MAESTKQIDKDSKKKFTKGDIEKPAEFRHITTVKFDCNTGLNVTTSDEFYKDIFKKAGISDKMLENCKTHECLYDVVSYTHSESSSHAPTTSAAKPPLTRVLPPSPTPRNSKRTQEQKDQLLLSNSAPSPTKVNDAQDVIQELKLELDKLKQRVCILENELQNIKGTRIETNESIAQGTNNMLTTKTSVKKESKSDNFTEYIAINPLENSFQTNSVIDTCSSDTTEKEEDVVKPEIIGKGKRHVTFVNTPRK